MDGVLVEKSFEQGLSRGRDGLMEFRIYLIAGKPHSGLNTGKQEKGRGSG